MKKQNYMKPALFLILASFSLKARANQNYMPYYQLVNQAYLLSYQGDYNKSFALFDLAFRSYSPMVLDVKNASYLSLKYEPKNKARTTKYLSYLYDEPNVSFSNASKFDKYFLSHPTKFANTRFNEIFDSIYASDQSIRRDRPFDQSIDSANMLAFRGLLHNDELHQNKLSNDRLIQLRVMISHFMHYEGFEDEVWDALLYGKFSPQIVAKVFDYYAMSRKDSIDYYTVYSYYALLKTKNRKYSINYPDSYMNKLEDNFDEQRVDSLRTLIGMPTYKEELALLPYMIKNDFYIFF